MSNDFYIDEEDRPDESEMMADHDEYFWHKAQKEQDEFNESMRVAADMRRKEIREERL